MFKIERELYMRKTFQLVIVSLIVISIFSIYSYVSAFENEESTTNTLKTTTLSRKYEKAKFLSFVNKDKESGEQEVIEIETDNTSENIVIEEDLEKIAAEREASRLRARQFVQKLFEEYLDGIKRIEELSIVAEQEEPIIEVDINSGENIVVEESQVVEEEPKVQEPAETNNGVPTNYVAQYDVVATGYCICQKCCGKSPSSPGYGVTASGLRIIPGTGMKVIAVDTKLVKLGTKVYVEGLNGSPSYGYAIAADRGGAIKNMRIDLYFDTHAEALKWGRRQVKLYILPD